MTLSNIGIGRTSGIALAALVLLALTFTPSAAGAADFEDYGWVDTASYDTWEPSYDSYDDYGWVDTAYYDTWEPEYDYETDYGSYGYEDTYGGSYGGGSYGGGSYGGGSFGGGSFFGSPSYIYQPQPSRPSSNSNTNNNYNNNQNQNINDVDVNVNVGAERDYDRNRDHDRDYDYEYEYDYRNPVVYNPPVYYNPTPYVTLSQVPYTGLELGFWGTIAYWSFLVVWCLIAAYLIAVKKVHTRIAARIKTILFGDDMGVSHPVYATNAPSLATAGVSNETLGEKFSRTEIAALASALIEALEGKTTRSYEPVAPAVQKDSTDPFILSQINRAK